MTKNFTLSPSWVFEKDISDKYGGKTGRAPHRWMQAS